MRRLWRDTRSAIGRRTIWLGVGAASLVACAIAVFIRESPGSLRDRTHGSRSHRACRARGAGREAWAEWRILPTPLDGSDGPHEFVAMIAGNERRKTLVGTVSAGTPMVCARREVRGGRRGSGGRVADGRLRGTRDAHSACRAGRPAGRVARGKRRAADRAGRARRTDGPQGRRSQAREISARPQKLKARTDWTFTFTDTTIEQYGLNQVRSGDCAGGSSVHTAHPNVPSGHTSHLGKRRAPPMHGSGSV